MWYNFGFREALVVPEILTLKKREGRVGRVTQNIGVPTVNLYNNQEEKKNQKTVVGAWVFPMNSRGKMLMPNFYCTISVSAASTSVHDSWRWRWRPYLEWYDIFSCYLGRKSISDKFLKYLPLIWPVMKSDLNLKLIRDLKKLVKFQKGGAVTHKSLKKNWSNFKRGGRSPHRPLPPIYATGT